MTNVTAMPVAQGAVVPGVAVAATGKGDKSDLLFGELLAVAVDGPAAQESGAGQTVPDEFASLIVQCVPMNLTSFVATVQQPAIAGSQTPTATGSESSISKVGVAINQAEVLASPILPAVPGVTQDTPVLSGEAKPDTFGAMLAQLIPATPRDSVAVQVPATSADPKGTVPVLVDRVTGLLGQKAPSGPSGQIPKASDSGAVGLVAQPVSETSDSIAPQAASPRAAVQVSAKTDRTDPTDAKPTQANAEPAPSGAFVMARQVAHDSGEARPLDTTQQLLTAALTADRPGERVASTVQVDSRPAGDNGASTQDSARSAASLLTPGQPFHQAMAEATATRSPEAVRTDTDLSRRVIDQVVREVSVHRLAGRTDMVVKLNPPDLGTLRLHLVQDAGGMTSHIQTTNEQVRGLLQAHLPALVDALSGAGVKLNSVSITSDPSFGALMHNSAQGGNQQQPDVPRRQFAGLPGDTVGILSSTGLYDAPSDGVGYSWLA